MKTKILTTLTLFLFCSIFTYAQRTLSEMEALRVNEAKVQLHQALSDPDMNEEQRIKIISRSATTLKQYGQTSEWPTGDLPLLEMMNDNFDQCKSQISELSAWTLELEKQTLDQKLEIINDIQIDVAEEQIQMLIPGSSTVQLSSDVVNTVFGVNIVEGMHGGKSSDAAKLTSKFQELAKTNKLINHINQLIEHDKESMSMIAKDRQELETKIPSWEKAYKDAEAGTFVLKGYEGAIVAPSQGSYGLNSNTIEGTWKFGFDKIGYFTWTFGADGEFTFQDGMNGGEPEKGKYTVQGNILNISGPARVCRGTEAKYTFIIESNSLRFTKIEDKCTERYMTLNHVWNR